MSKIGSDGACLDALRSTGKLNKTKRLSALLPNIEAALKRGVSHQEILDRLNTQGFDLTMNTYSVMLWKIRSRVKKALNLTPPSTVVKASKTAWRDSQQGKAVEAQATTEGSKSTAVPKPNVLDWDPQRPVKW
jgi:hypothetical protein